jgi:hypothetical protein
MFNQLCTAFSAVLAGAAISGSVIAQEGAPVQRPASGANRPVAAGSKVEVVRLSTVMKSKVLIQEDKAAGQVVDVVMNDGGCVDYFVASYENEYYAIPYSAVTVRHSDRIVFVDITPAQFRKVTFFGTDQWPDFYSTTYQKEVFSVFGVNSVREDGRRDALKPNLDRRNDAQDRRNPNDEGTAGEKGANTPRDRKDADTPRERLQDRSDNLKDKAEPKTERKAEPKSERKPEASPTPRSDNKPNLPERPKAEPPKAEKPKADAPKPIAPSQPKPKNP